MNTNNNPLEVKTYRGSKIATYRGFTITESGDQFFVLFNGHMLEGNVASIEAGVALIDAGSYDADVADIIKQDKRSATARENMKSRAGKTKYAERIGELVRAGRTVYYATIDGVQRESYDRSDIVRRIEQEGK